MLRHRKSKIALKRLQPKRLDKYYGHGLKDWLLKKLGPWAEGWSSPEPEKVEEPPPLPKIKLQPWLAGYDSNSIYDAYYDEKAGLHLPQPIAWDNVPNKEALFDKTNPNRDAEIKQFYETLKNDAQEWRKKYKFERGKTIHIESNQEVAPGTEQKYFNATPGATFTNPFADIEAEDLDTSEFEEFLKKNGHTVSMVGDQSGGSMNPKYNPLQVEKQHGGGSANSGTTDTQIDKKAKQLQIPGWLGCFPSNQLPQHPPPGSCLIANYSPSTDRGTHWVAMMHLNVPNQPSLFFDSYGFSPDGEDPLFHVLTKFQQYLKQNSGTHSFIYNKMNVQNITSDVCGEYCLYACAAGKIPQEPDGKLDPIWSKIINLRDNPEQTDENVKHAINMRN